MREVVAGNTLYDLGVCVGDVVYFDDAVFEKRGDDLTITRVIGNPDGTNTYYSDAHKLAGDQPKWHVVKYDDRLSADNITTISTAGVQGYSSPTPDAVVFNISDNVYELICQSEAWSSLVAEHLSVGGGMYNGVAEAAYSLPKAVFDEMYRRWPWIMHDQETILILGTPESQNWRPATLLFLHTKWRDEGDTIDNGTWHEVDEMRAMQEESWSHFNGHWFICEHYPAEDVETAKERLVEEKLKLLDSVMSRICAMPQYDMERYGLYHDWATWAAIGKRPGDLQ